jgi:hypothetical protein
MSQPADPNPQPNPYESPEPVAAAPVVPASFDPAPVDPELQALQSQMLQLQAQGQSGANWFYWVAGLSLVNSVIALVGGGVSFVVGLGVTGIADAIAFHIAKENPEMSLIAKGGAFGFSLLASAVVVGFGWMSNKRIIPIFALGMALYLLDGLLYVLLQQWMCVAFHAFALFSMLQGLIAYRKLSAILRSQPAMA